MTLQYWDEKGGASVQILAFWEMWWREDNSAEIFLPTVDEKLKLFNRPFFRPAAENGDFFGFRMQSDETEGYPWKWDTEVEGGKKEKKKNNFMIVSEFSKKNSYDRRYLKRILS